MLISGVAVVAHHCETCIVPSLVMAQGISLTALRPRTSTAALLALTVICARCFCFAAVMAPAFLLFLWMLCVCRASSIWLGGQLVRILRVFGVLNPAGERECQHREVTDVRLTRKRRAKLLKLIRFVLCHASFLLFSYKDSNDQPHWKHSRTPKR